MPDDSPQQQRRFRKATIDDVAARAGVSKTTVSLYLAGRKGACSPETAQRIREAAAALHYTPARATRGLPQRATRTVGVSVALPSDPEAVGHGTFAGQIWAGISRAADADDYRLLHYPAAVRAGADPAPFLDGLVDGLILNTHHDDRRPEALAAAGLPVVLLTRVLSVPDGCGAAHADEADTVRLAMEHLWGLGHRRVAHLAGLTPVRDDDPFDLDPAAGAMRSEVAMLRRDLWRDFLAERGAYAPALLGSALRWTDELRRVSGIVGAWRALPAGSRPTAVFAANDSLALAALAAARAHRWRVPEELSIVGVDDSAAGAAADPPLTSVAVPANAVGERAFAALLALMAGAPAGECRVSVPVARLVVRGTTAAPP